MKTHYLPLLFKEGWRAAPGWFDYRSRPPRPFGPPPLGRGGIKMHSAGVVRLQEQTPPALRATPPWQGGNQDAQRRGGGFFSPPLQGGVARSAGVVLP